MKIVVDKVIVLKLVHKIVVKHVMRMKNVEMVIVGQNKKPPV